MLLSIYYLRLLNLFKKRAIQSRQVDLSCFLDKESVDVRIGINVLLGKSSRVLISPSCSLFILMNMLFLHFYRVM